MCFTTRLLRSPQLPVVWFYDSVRSTKAEAACRHVWNDSHTQPSCPLLSQPLGAIPWDPRAILSHTHIPWDPLRVEFWLLCSFKMKHQSVLTVLNFYLSIGSHQPKEGRCLWCAKKSTCKCKYISFLLPGSRDLCSYVCSLRKGTPLLDTGHDPCGFTGDCMLGLPSGSEGRKHTGQTGGAADLYEGLASWVAVSWIVQTTTSKGLEVSGVL